ncbi:collagen-like protein [Dyadobacter sp. NIV53]|uniref:collagen-like protein n=1 Tax=Dyadobacter sp. NIV53 TaxID=2861765 RepID=UPI001C88A106|nr:collagen-like protein [Dyadobacter sp. NIV53]
MLKKYLILVFVSLAIFSIGCDGPKGDVGPVGPKGDTGETGATGPAGADAENPDQTAFFYTNGTKVTDSLGNLEIKYANFFQGSTAEGIKSARWRSISNIY